jgi:hypothetical protein
MSEQQRETAFLKQVIRYDDTGERHQLEERIDQDQRNERCVRRAVGFIIVLIGLAMAGLCYPAVLVTDTSQKSRLLIKTSSALGLGSLICLPIFLGFWGICRRKLDQRREECRRLATQLIESRLGKPRDLPAWGCQRTGDYRAVESAPVGSENDFSVDKQIHKEDPKLIEKVIMNKMFAIALLVGGVVLMVLGVQATDSFSSDVSRFFTGSPTDKAVWMLIGGVVASVMGLAMTLRGSRQG